jgi:glycerophosphoryl diester phosphodiesterase
MSALSYRRVGHKGADHIAPGNTLASFDAALAAGVDMVEFDVLRLSDGRLVLAHDLRAAQSPGVVTLEEGLDHFITDAYAGIELDVDLKRAGYEREVLDALRARDLIGRSLVSTMEEESLAVVRALAPDVRLGWSVPKMRRNPLSHPVTKPLALLGAIEYRRRLAKRVVARLQAGEIDAVMAHYAVVDRRLVRAVRAAGGELYVWTVDEPKRIARLERLGVTGIISNDPRLFVSG